MQPRFEEKKEFYVIGIGNQFERGKTEEIGMHLWPEFSKRLNEIPNKKGKDQDGFTTYGISQEIWIGGILQPHFKYFAAVEVDLGTKPPNGMEYIKINKQNYAVFTHRDGLKKLPQTIQYIWGTWAPQSEYKLSIDADLEIYSSNFAPNNGVPFEIWVSLAEKR